MCLKICNIWVKFSVMDVHFKTNLMMNEALYFKMAGGPQLDTYTLGTYGHCPNVPP